MNDRRGFAPQTRLGLCAAVAVPILYFGVQLAAAPFYPGYDFLANSASQLGSDHSSFPAILNVGAIVMGVTALVAACGLGLGLSTAGARAAWAWLVALAVASAGAGAIWAGAFPLPDPRHSPGALGFGTFLGPVLLLAAVWPMPRAHGLRAYLVSNLVAFALLAPVMGGATGVDLKGFGGLVQRLAAVVTFVPIGVVGAFLLRRAPGSFERGSRR